MDNYKQPYNLRPTKKRKKEKTLNEVIKKCDSCGKEPVKLKQEAIFKLLKVKK